MITLTLFGRTGGSLTQQLAGGIFLLLILEVPVRVKTQCPVCTSKSVKTVNVTTGECISCFPCLQCVDGQTSSVPCGSTVPFGTDIKCVLIQSSLVVTKTSAQTRHVTDTLVTISSSAQKLIVTPVTSVTRPVVVPATSSAAPAPSSIKYGSETTEKPKSEALPYLGDYAEWKKNTSAYILSAACLLIVFVAIIWRISKLKNKQLQRQAVNRDRHSSSAVASPSQESEVQQQPVNPADRSSTSVVQPWSCTSHSGTCNINLATRSVAFSCSLHKGTDISIEGDGNRMFQPKGNMSSTLATASVNVVQPHTQLDSSKSWPHNSFVNVVRNGPITDGLEQERPVNWSGLSQREKYNTKVLEMPFSLLYKICLTLDIKAADGNDVRMLAEKLGISVSNLALLKQAAITQHPDDSFCNSTTSVVLAKKSSLTVGDFVNIMEVIERDDVIRLINN